MLEDRFGIPSFINNDGSLFAYGEAIAGLLPYVNGLLAATGRPKRYQNLVGITLGTGLGGGIVCDGEMLVGDNSCAGELWLMRNKLEPDFDAEEGACIRAVRRVYAEEAGVAFDEAPDPRGVFEIGSGLRAGDQRAALKAFRHLAEVVGDAAAQASTLVDGLVVIGGGISRAWPLFLSPLVAEMNGTYGTPKGRRLRRLAPLAFDLEDLAQRERFLEGAVREIVVPGGVRRIAYDAAQRVGVGVSRLGTSEAIAVGAYAFALGRLDAAAP